MILAFQVKKHRSMRLIIIRRLEILQSVQTEVLSDSLHSHHSSVLLALERISGDVRSRDVRHFKKVKVDIRLMAPCVYDHSSELRLCRYKRLLINNFTSCRVNKDSSRTHEGEEGLISHAPGVFIQRNMHGHDIRVLQQILHRAEFLRTFCGCSWRVAKQDIESKIASHRLHLRAHMSHTYDTDCALLYLDAFTGRDAIYCREYILHDSSCIAACSILHMNAV